MKGDFRTDTQEVWNRWLTFTAKKGYKSKDKSTFYNIFDELVGNSSTKTSRGTGYDRVQYYAFSGFRMLTDGEIDKKEQRTLTPVTKSSISSVLSLFSIKKNNKNYNRINIKVVELLELVQSSND